MEGRSSLLVARGIVSISCFDKKYRTAPCRVHVLPDILPRPVHTLQAIRGAPAWHALMLSRHVSTSAKLLLAC